MYLFYNYDIVAHICGHRIRKGNWMSEKKLKILGWIGTVLSVFMYVSYIPQIWGDVHGHKTPFIQPLAAAVNCTIWTAYGLLKEKRDYPLSAANLPGVIFGLIATIAAF